MDAMHQDGLVYAAKVAHVIKGNGVDRDKLHSAPI